MAYGEIGRPLKLTPKTQQIIIHHISKGSTYKLAAQAAGMRYETFNHYMKLGEAQLDEEDGDMFLHFYNAVKKAEAERAEKWLSIIENAAEADAKNWTAAAWKLERCHREAYSRDASEITEFIEMYKFFKDHVSKGNVTHEEKNPKEESNA